MAGPTAACLVLAAAALLVLGAGAAADAADAPDGGEPVDGPDVAADPVPTVVHAGPALVVLIFHPFPDHADPLGFPYPEGGRTDGYYWRYQHLDREGDGFEFPHVVVDGVTSIEGLPDASRPYASTRDAYTRAFEERRALDPPAVMALSAHFGTGGGVPDDAAPGPQGLAPDTVHASAVVVPRADLGGERLHLWFALVEDHVYYAPPAHLTNGVVDHRFTVHALHDAGPLDLAAADGAVAVQVTLPVPTGADAEQVYVAAWLQGTAGHGVRFSAHEVVQATIHRVAAGGETRQETKGVLMQLYSATWCAPCLFGDRVAEEIAEQYGVATVGPTGRGPDYLRAPTNPLLAAAALLAGALLVALPRLSRTGGAHGRDAAGANDAAGGGLPRRADGPPKKNGPPQENGPPRGEGPQ